MITLSGPALSKIDRQDPVYLALVGAHPRLAKKDPTIWGPAAATEAAAGSTGAATEGSGNRAGVPPRDDGGECGVAG